MEKFGIFELLDALSAIAAPESGERENAASPPAANGETENTESAAAEHAPTPPEARERDALAVFLARHDGISKKIDGKK